jgi:redox-sensitive bicupin YhaK (pirin superfamily)
VWVALPGPQEEAEPAFAHHDASELPAWDDAGARVRLIVGQVSGARSPVRVHSEMLYLDVALAAGARYAVPVEPAERAAYIVEGQLRLGSDPQVYEAGRLLVFGTGRDIVLSADAPARLALFGGEPLDAPRFVWWNFVSSSRQRIEQAQADWKAGRFPPVPGETEFIPLPERPFVA